MSTICDRQLHRSVAEEKYFKLFTQTHNAIHMHPSLTDHQIIKVREALLHEYSGELIDLIFRLNLSLSIDSVTDNAVSTASRLGWINANPTPQLTTMGWLIADPLREYRFWLDRDRRIHGELEHDLLVPERYEGKSVLEVGCGFGCNLFSLTTRTQGKFIGVEPMEIYRQFAAILAEREGINAPEIMSGSGESLPFKECSFDVVLCYSAHQYMDIVLALEQMSRVLKPGGQLQIIGGTLDVLNGQLIRNLIKRPSPSIAINHVRIAINTWSYKWLRRRLWTPSSMFTTAAPIYPLKNDMLEWISGARLEPRHDLIKRVGNETCFVAEKPLFRQFPQTASD